MERLTHERCNGIKAGYWSPEKKDDLVQRLAAYEDTGLTPEQIHELDKMYLEKCQEVNELKRQQKWIPTAERLPENPDISVLVQISGRPNLNIDLQDALELATYNPDEGWILEEYPEWEEAAPVAWMLLPESYQEK